MSAVLAYFSSDNTARRAREILAEYGITEVSIDTVKKWPDAESTRQRMNMIGGKITSLSNLTQGTDFQEGQGILASANPAASGMSAPDDMLQHQPFLLTAVCKPEHIDIIRKILADSGGFLGS